MENQGEEEGFSGFGSPLAETPDGQELQNHVREGTFFGFWESPGSDNAVWDEMLRDREEEEEDERRRTLLALRASSPESDTEINAIVPRNEKEKRFKKLFKEVYAAYRWLEENRGEFSGTIFGPLGLMVNVKDEDENAKYIEHCLSLRTYCYFISKDENHLYEFQSRILKKFDFHIEVSHVSEGFDLPVHGNFQPYHKIETIKEYGFYAYPIDFLEGPNPVLNELCSQCSGLYRIPIGKNLVPKNIPKEICPYFCGSGIISGMKFSKYSGLPSYMELSVRPIGILYNFGCKKDMESEDEEEELGSPLTESPDGQEMLDWERDREEEDSEAGGRALESSRASSPESD